MNSLAGGQSLPAGLSYDHVCVCVCVCGFFIIGLYYDACQGFMNQQRTSNSMSQQEPCGCLVTEPKSMGHTPLSMTLVIDIVIKR